MKKKLVTIVLALVLALPATIPAHAAGCVSKAEYSKIRTGMSVSAVASLTGTNGSRSGYSKIGSQSSEVRSYKTCTAFGSVAISYSNGRVAAKSGIF